jgi:hypothetical protein
MEITEIGLIYLELKYCERCGALWLRPGGSDVVFCGNCARAAVELAKWENSSRAGSLSVPYQSAFWSEGGNA